ncbi:MAG: hemolysin family protein [Eubacteriales bacterium]
MRQKRDAFKLYIGAIWFCFAKADILLRDNYGKLDSKFSDGFMRYRRCTTILKNSIIMLLLLQLLFITVNAIFASAEIAVITMNSNKLLKLASNGDIRAKRLVKLTKQPAGFLATIQVGITLINLLSAAVATENFSGRLTSLLLKFGSNLSEGVISSLSVVIITIILTYFTVLLGELVPKRIAMKKAEKIALGMSGPLFIFSKIFIPAVWAFTASTNLILRIFGINPLSEEEKDAEEEIRLILDVGKMKGTILSSEHTMIQNVFEFNDISAKEVMVARSEVTCLSLGETPEQWDEVIKKTKHSKYPVYSETPDKITGVFYAKEYFGIENKTMDNVLAESVHPAYLVPETIRADVLFQNMQKARSHFAIVVDSKGVMSGIITMNDLLEQIVGDLDDD